MICQWDFIRSKPVVQFLVCHDLDAERVFNITVEINVVCSIQSEVSLHRGHCRKESQPLSSHTIVHFKRLGSQHIHKEIEIS